MSFFSTKSPNLCTLPKTNQIRFWKWMVPRRSFHVGAIDWFSGSNCCWFVSGYGYSWWFRTRQSKSPWDITLLETNRSRPLKIGPCKKERIVFQTTDLFRAIMYAHISFTECSETLRQKWLRCTQLSTHLSERKLGSLGDLLGMTNHFSDPSVRDDWKIQVSRENINEMCIP